MRAQPIITRPSKKNSQIDAENDRAELELHLRASAIPRPRLFTFGSPARTSQTTYCLPTNEKAGLSRTLLPENAQKRACQKLSAKLRLDSPSP